MCFDETNKEQHREVISPLPAHAGQVARIERTYERNGVSNLCMFFAPLENWREVTDRRTAVDWAQCMKELVDVHFPDAERIVVVQDNLNTHLSGRALRGVRAGGGQTDLGSAGVPVHAQTRQLAEHGGDRVMDCTPLAGPQ